MPCDMLEKLIALVPSGKINTSLRMHLEAGKGEAEFLSSTPLSSISHQSFHIEIF